MKVKIICLLFAPDNKMHIAGEGRQHDKKGADRKRRVDSMEEFHPEKSMDCADENAEEYQPNGAVWPFPSLC